MQENDVQLEAMVAMPRLVEAHNLKNKLHLTWWNTFPHSRSQAIDSATSRAYDFLGMTSQRKILLIEFKVCESRSKMPRVSKITENQLAFLKKLGGNIFPYVVFNQTENLAKVETTPGLEKSEDVLNNLLAIEPSKFSISDFGASHFSDPNKANITLLKRFEVFLTENPSEGEFAPLMACLFRGVKPVRPNNLVLLCMSDLGVRTFGWAKLVKLRDALFKGEGDEFNRAAMLYEKINEELKNCIGLRKQSHEISQKLSEMHLSANGEEKSNFQILLHDVKRRLKTAEREQEILENSFRELILLQSSTSRKRRGKKFIVKA